MEEYPLVLLPKQAYKLKIDLASADTTALFVVRRSLVSKEETTNDLGSVRSHAFIPPDQGYLFFSLSFNLLGLFEKKHLIYTLSKEHGRRQWLSKEEIPALDQIDFEINEDACPIYLNVDVVYNKPLDYEKGNSKGKPTPFLGQCRIAHKPLEANYWHFEIEVYETDGNKIKPGDTEWKKEAAMNFFESYLKFHLNCNDIDSMPDERLYLES